MDERKKLTAEEIRAFLDPLQGREVSLNELRKELQIEKGTKAFDEIRNILFQLAEQKIVKPSGKRDGIWKVIKKVQAVPVFSVQRERRPPFPLIFPRDRDTEMEFGFAEHVVVREGDGILLAGESNYGKTTLAMNILGENIERYPILLGNEFTHIVGEKIEKHEPTPRFLNRLDAMDWVQWTNGNGEDKFTLLPVYEDFAESIVRDKINIIDWVNLPGEYWMISPLMEALKRAIGRGILVLVIQKNPGLDHGVGGARTRDFADLEILIDKHSSYESRITIGKAKETTSPISGRSWAFGIFQGVKLTNVREVKKCPRCFAGSRMYTCEECNGKGWIDNT